MKSGRKENGRALRTSSATAEKVATFHARLRTWRKQRGVTIDKLYKAVDALLPPESRVVRSTVARFEKDRFPRADWLEALVEAYPELNLPWLISGEGVMEKMSAEEWDRRIDEAKEKDPEGYETDPVGFALGAALMSGADWAVSELERRLGLDGLDTLPRVSRHLMYRFIEDVTGYGARKHRPSFSKDLEPQDPRSTVIAMNDPTWGTFVRMFVAPFNDPGGAFVQLHSLTDVEVDTYTMALLSALRPLAFRLRYPDVRHEAPPLDVTDESDEA